MKRILFFSLIFSFASNLEAQILLDYESPNDSIKIVDFSSVKDSSNWRPKGEFVLPDIFFDYNKYTLRPESLVVLDQFANFLMQHPHYIIEISNHRDCRGSDLYSSNLTQRRAQSVVDYLITKGVNEKRLVARGYGDSKPLKLEGILLSCEYISSFTTDKEIQEKLYQFNRRTEFTILSTEFNQ